MPSALAHLWHHHRLLLLIFAAGLAASLLFAVRLVAFWVYWANPDHLMLAPEGWMTVGYLARSWEVSPDTLLAIIPAERTPGEPPTLAELAESRGESLPDLIARLETGLRAATPDAPPPP
jgi:hypothetical protein